MFCGGVGWNAPAWIVECLCFAMILGGVLVSGLFRFFCFAWVWGGMLAPGLWNALVLQGVGVECSRLACGMLLFCEGLGGYALVWLVELSCFAWVSGGMLVPGLWHAFVF